MKRHAISLSAGACGVSARKRQYVAYYRVSTPRQAESELGLDAQRASVRGHVEREGGKLVGEFSESISGRKNDRPQLNEALRVCRYRRATLIVARLDRLSRNLGFTTQLMESGLDFVAVDFPHANRFTIHVLAALAEYEANLISERLRAAYAAAKARGAKFGGWRGQRPTSFAQVGVEAANRVRFVKSRTRARDLAPILWQLVAEGHSKQAIADELNRRGIPAPRRKGWCLATIGLLLKWTKDEFAGSADVKRALKLGPASLRKTQRLTDAAPLVWEMKRAGRAAAEIAAELGRRGFTPPSDKGWTSGAIYRLVLATKDGFRAPDAATWRKPTPSHIALARARDHKLAPLVWSMRAKGQSAGEIADELNRREIPGPRKQWDKQSIARILRATVSEFADVARNAKPIVRRPQSAKRQAQLRSLGPLFWQLIRRCETMEQVADELNRRELRTRRGLNWTANTARWAIKEMHAEHGFNPDGLPTDELNPKRMAYLKRSAELLAIVRPLIDAGLSQPRVAAELNRRRVPTPKNGRWHQAGVLKLLRLAPVIDARASLLRDAA
jgi:DNA invertase Pin-like site-specific DNA recombinase